MNPFELKPHPYSKIFPNESDGAFAELVASIKKLGRLRYPVIIYDDQILDGNRRLRACRIAKVEPKFIQFQGSDREALEVVWDLNYNRRHLSASQRSFAFAEYCKFADEGHPSQHGAGTTLEQAAKKVHVGKSTMQYAKKSAQHGTEEQKQSIREGKSTVKQVASAIRTKPKNGEVDVDSSGIPIPEAAKKFWDRRGEAREILAFLKAARGKIRLLHSDDPMWSEVNLNGVTGDLNSAIGRFGKAILAHVCPYCQGLRPEKCTTCKGRGVISKYMWDVAVPDELKAIAKK